ncbi:MAG: helix-turn-helix domain-containing protein [Gammaproteobacteria bacterium]|nr:MAG: helix-turn-helix domain-containing protein [Gammaproteobacteria bacterium]
MKLGGRVKQRRCELGWSQEELSKRSGIGQGTISKMERTDQGTSTFVVELAEALGVSPKWLQTGRGDPQGIGEPSATYSTSGLTALVASGDVDLTLKKLAKLLPHLTPRQRRSLVESATAMATPDEADETPDT